MCLITDRPLTDKERDIVERTQQMQRQLDAAAAAGQQQRAELAAVQQQLSDSKHGLLAAARITDQLESAQMANTNLRDEREFPCTCARVHVCMLCVCS